MWLKSGGYIVINQTEALVAIDVNTGKFVGKSNRLEDTIVKTNTEAVKEIVRQMRLRDLGGIIVVDFIDMDERKNRQKVMQALEEAMRSDRAPNKILQFNDFGLVAITRKRVKQSLERTLCSPCPYCEGAGYVKSVQTVIGEILQEAHKIAARRRRLRRDAARPPGRRQAAQVQRQRLPRGDRGSAWPPGAGDQRRLPPAGEVRPGFDRGITMSGMAPRYLYAVAALAAGAWAQSLRVYSEFQRIDPFGAVVAADRAERPREILSPAVARSAYATFQVVVTVPAGSQFSLYVAQNPEDAVRVTAYLPTFVKLGNAWIPDGLEPLRLSEVHQVLNPVRQVPGQTVTVVWLDLWVAPDAPVRRTRFEVQLFVGEQWIIYPMELRIIAPVVPAPRGLSSRWPRWRLRPPDPPPGRCAPTLARPPAAARKGRLRFAR